MKLKFWLIRITFVLIFGALVVNLYSIQVQKGNYYAQKAQAREELSGQLMPQRGVIYITDKYNNNIPVVLNKDYPTIYAVPKEIKDPADAAAKLAPIIGMNQQLLQAKLSQQNLYALLAQKANQDQVASVQQLNIPGIYMRDEIFRFYPFSTMAANVLGFTSTVNDGDVPQGKYGVEREFNDILEGKSGTALADEVRKPTDGSDVHLTIDRNVQAEGEQIISDLMAQWHAASAGFIVEDPMSGKILGMGNLPTFDPNNYSQASSLKDYINSNVESVYEPGSVIKVLTMSAGIDSGKITPDTTYVDTGSVTLNGSTIRNWDLKAHGKLTMTNVIEQSLNTGAVFAERTMGSQIFTEYIKKFGLGDRTGIDLPSEASGDLSNLNHGLDINYATASYGQGIAITPIELASAISTIANGGLLMKPLITQDEVPTVLHRVISQDTASKVTAMMVSAVNKNILAHIPQYNVAGKSGTANLPDFQHGGYYPDRYADTFAGFAPASHPQFVLIMKIMDPQNGPLAGAAVVPSFKKFMEFLLNYYDVPPDNQTVSATP